MREPARACVPFDRGAESNLARQFPPRPQRRTESTLAASDQPIGSRTSAIRDPGVESGTSHTVVSSVSRTGQVDLPSASVPLARNYSPPLERVLADDLRDAPSLPIILVSAAVGVATSVVTFFLLSELTSLRLEWSVGFSTLALLFGMGACGALLSAATGSRAAVPNMLFSCGTILLLALFFGICIVTGALGATLLLFLRA